MKKKWLKPEVKNLNLKSTNENIEDCSPDGVQELILAGFLGSCKKEWCIHRGLSKYKGYCYCHRDLADKDDGDNDNLLS